MPDKPNLDRGLDKGVNTPQRDRDGQKTTPNVEKVKESTRKELDKIVKK
jgi:hypothetical protein